MRYASLVLCHMIESASNADDNEENDNDDNSDDDMVLQEEN